MKKSKIALLLPLVLCCALLLPAFGESTPAPMEKRAKGFVTLRDTEDYYASLGGQVMPFELEAGDTVADGDLLMNLRPLTLLSPADGVVRSLQGEIGDQAGNVMAQYGGLCYIERQDVQLVSASTQGAYDKPENRAIYIGETLRVYNGNANDVKETEGHVISMEGAAYVVEIPAGVFDLEDTVRLYRGTGDSYKDKDMVGRGKVANAAPVAVLGEGVIANVHVTEGQEVQKGDLLFTIDSATARHTTAPSTSISAKSDALVSAIYVQKGQQVAKDQLLFTLSPLSPMEVVVDVDETDVLSLSVGQMVKVTYDAFPDARYSAIVKEISPMGTTVLDTTKYPVTLTLTESPQGLLPGMHATAYFE